MYEVLKEMRVKPILKFIKEKINISRAIPLSLDCKNLYLKGPQSDLINISMIFILESEKKTTLKFM